jgi:hypothetical protein
VSSAHNRSIKRITRTITHLHPFADRLSGMKASISGERQPKQFPPNEGLVDDRALTL